MSVDAPQSANPAVPNRLWWWVVLKTAAVIGTLLVSGGEMIVYGNF